MYYKLLRESLEKLESQYINHENPQGMQTMPTSDKILSAITVQDC